MGVAMSVHRHWNVDIKKLEVQIWPRRDTENVKAWIRGHLTSLEWIAVKAWIREHLKSFECIAVKLWIRWHYKVLEWIVVSFIGKRKYSFTLEIRVFLMLALLLIGNWAMYYSVHISWPYIAPEYHGTCVCTSNTENVFLSPYWALYRGFRSGYSAIISFALRRRVRWQKKYGRY
jgi:hypothetical protein